MKECYEIPQNVKDDILSYEFELERFRAGEIDAEGLKATFVLAGVMVALAAAVLSLTKLPRRAPRPG